LKPDFFLIASGFGHEEKWNEQNGLLF